MAEEARSSEAEEVARQEALVKEQENLETKAAEEGFLRSLKKRDELQGALDALEESKKAFKTARNEQRKGRQSLESERQEAIDAGAENVPTVYELLKTEEDELDVHPGEEDYKNKKENVVGAAKQLKEKIEVLRSLGVDPMDKTNEELIQEVKKIKEEEALKVREYARQNPDSELPEVQEVRQEMIKERESELVESIYRSGRVLFGGATNRALSEFERNGWFKKDLSGEDSYTRDQLRERLPRLVLQEIKKSEEYKKVLEVLGEDVYKQGGQFDSIDTEAFSGATKKLLLNYTEGYRGESDKFRSIDPTRAHTTWENSIQTENTLRKIYESFPGQSVQEFKYEDGSGFKYESLHHIATLFDGEALKKFSIQTYEAASLKGQLDRWDQDKAKIVRERESDTREQATLSNQRDEAQRNTEALEGRQKTYEGNENELQILIAEIPLVQGQFAGEELNLTTSYNELRVALVSDTEKYNALQEEQNGLLASAEESLKNAKDALSKAKNIPRPKLFGKDKYDASISDLEGKVREAEQALLDTQTKRTQAFQNQHREQQARSKDTIVRLGERVGIRSFKGSWEDFLIRVQEEAESALERIRLDKISNEENIRVSKEKQGQIQASLDQTQKSIEEKTNILETIYDERSREIAQRRMADLVRSSF